MHSIVTLVPIKESGYRRNGTRQHLKKTGITLFHVVLYQVHVRASSMNQNPIHVEPKLPIALHRMCFLTIVRAAVVNLVGPIYAQGQGFVRFYSSGPSSHPVRPSCCLDRPKMIKVQLSQALKVKTNTREVGFLQRSSELDAQVTFHESMRSAQMNLAQVGILSPHLAKMLIGDGEVQGIRTLHPLVRQIGKSYRERSAYVRCKQYTN